MRLEKAFNKAFTLVELLVVISIIAVLMSVLMPALSKVRKQAWSVVCQSNLKNWGTFYQIYAADNNGYFPIRSESASEWAFNETFPKHYKQEAESLSKMMICPAAKKIPAIGNNTGPLGHEFGGAKYCWLLTNMELSENGSHSSYGENAWIKNIITDGNTDLETRNKKTWKTMANVKDAGNVPIMSDARAGYAWPDHTDALPPKRWVPEKLFYNSWNWMSINCFVMRRHNDGLNVVTADMAVKRVAAEKLWQFKWHRQYKTQDVGNCLSWMKSD